MCWWRKRSAPLRIVGVLPVAYLGASYLGRLEASGGTPPYHWRVKNELPVALSLDGNEVTGIPARVGEWQIEVEVTDSGIS